MAGDKTEKATPHRREEERKKGNIFQSKDVTGAIGLVAIFGFAMALKDLYRGAFETFLTQCFGSFADVTELNVLTAQNFLSRTVLQILLLSLPLLLVASIIGVAVDLFQTRMKVSAQKLKFDFKKLNFFKGLKNLISIRSVAELIKSIVKIVCVGVVLYSEINGNLPNIANTMDKDVGAAFQWIVQSIVMLGVKVGGVMIAFGAADYLYQWWYYERQIMMTKQEIKDENKKLEGDPLIKGHIRNLQRKMAQMRTLQEVPKADLLVRNPTHYAIAIKYDPEKNAAPVVLAKGQDYLALKMVEVAERNHVVVTENPPLARGLYASVETGMQIPEEFYQAVAELLAFVYSLKHPSRGRNRA